MPKNVLIITYYWPPKAGGGVHRWLKMSRYIPENGWNATIYTPEMNTNALEDISLESEIHASNTIIRKPIWEPYQLYKWFTRKKKNEKIYSGFVEEKGAKRWKKQISLFIRGNFFIPDARMFWIRPSARFLVKYCEEHSIDCIISTGPPHSMHRIAYRVKKKLSGLLWIADFRDPWTNINFYDKLKTTPIADALHKRLEKQVLTTCDKVVTVSRSWAQDFQKLSGRNDVQVITNGYDPKDFEHSIAQDSTKFTIIHVGSMNPDRNPRVLWRALETLIKKVPEIKEHLTIQLIGVVDHIIVDSLEQHGLKDFLLLEKYKAHSEVVADIQKAQILLLPINTTKDAMGILPGKLYEYIGAKRPIFCICPPKSDAEQIIQSTGAGVTLGYEDYALAEHQLNKWYMEFKAHGSISINSENSEVYSRRALAKNYIDLIESLV